MKVIMANNSGHVSGGFEPRYSVLRLDGNPSHPDSRYLVLNYSGSDPHAIVAIGAYADSIESENPEFASDLREAILDPQNSPPQHPFSNS